MRTLILSSIMFSILYFIFSIFRKINYAKYKKQTFRLIWIILILMLLIPILTMGIRIPIQLDIITPISADIVNSLQNFQLPWNSFPHYFTKIWELGFVLSISIVVIHYIYFRISLNRSLFGSSLEATKIVEDYNLPIQIKMTTQNIPPFVTGIFEKVLVLPQYSCDIKHQKDLDYIIRHEMTHIRKKDIIFKKIYLLARCIHWFNPLVYLMGKKLTVDIEMACDEVVSETLSNNDKKEYCNMLYKHSINNNSINYLYSNALSHSSTKIKERFDSILNPNKKQGKNILVISYLLLAFVSTLAIADFSPGTSKAMESNLNYSENGYVTMHTDNHNNNDILYEVEVSITFDSSKNIYKKSIMYKDKINK